MLPRAARLHHGADIQSTSRRGSRVRVGDLSVALRTRDRSELDVPDGARVGVVVGRPAGNAVQRNRQRRRIRHAVAAMWPTLPPGADLVLRAGPGVGALTTAELRRDLARGVERAARRAATHASAPPPGGHR